MKRWVFSATLLATACGVLPLQAHAASYFFKTGNQNTVETALGLASPTTTQRFFGRLETKKDVDYFTFKASKGMRIFATLEVPVADEKFHPTLTLFGPGLNKPKEDPVIAIGDTNGAVVANEPANGRDSVWDTYLLTTFLIGPKLDLPAPEDATYGLAVRVPDGATGRYVLNVGTEDVWDWGDLIPRIWGVTRAILRIY